MGLALRSPVVPTGRIPTASPAHFPSPSALVPRALAAFARRVPFPAQVEGKGVVRRASLPVCVCCASVLFLSTSAISTLRGTRNTEGYPLVSKAPFISLAPGKLVAGGHHRHDSQIRLVSRMSSESNPPCPESKVRVDKCEPNGEGNDEDGEATRPNLTEKQLRKLRAKQMKRERRARRESGKSTKTKACGLCKKDVQLLIRCQIDETQNWHMVCGKCWNTVSGGVPDGDSEHPHYRYGGLWKAR